MNIKPFGLSLLLFSIILAAFSPAALTTPVNESGNRIISAGKPYGLSDTASAAGLPRLIGKIYLHTDCTWYFPGDDIEFKAYLI